MPSVDHATFDTLKSDLGEELDRVATRFSTQRGLVWNRSSYLKQASHTGEIVREALSFGMDVWPSENEDGGQVLPLIPPSARNVIFLPRTLGAIAASIALFALIWQSMPTGIEALAESISVQRVQHDATEAVTGTTPLIPDAIG